MAKTPLKDYVDMQSNRPIRFRADEIAVKFCNIVLRLFVSVESQRLTTLAHDAGLHQMATEEAQALTSSRPYDRV